MPGGYVGGRPKDESKLSRRPEQVRVRMRRAVKKAKQTGDYSVLRRDLEIYASLGVPGFKPVSEWDLEELAHGKPRRKDGSFRGSAPTWITPEVTREAKKLLYQQTMGKLGGNMQVAITVIRNLMTNDEVDNKGRPVVDARTKLAAAQFVIEHIIGKPTAQLEFNAIDSVRQMFAAAIVLDDGRKDSHLAIEGEVVEDDIEAGD